MKNIERVLVTGVTIDSEGTKIKDDAIKVEVEGNINKVSIILAEPTVFFKENGKEERGFQEGINNRHMIDPSFVMEKISLNYGNEHRPSLTIQMHFDNRMDISECEIFESLFKSNGEFTYWSLVKSIRLNAKKHDIEEEAKEQADLILYMGKLLTEKDGGSLDISELNERKKSRLISKAVYHFITLCNQQIARIIFDNYGDYGIYLIKNPNGRGNIYSRIPDENSLYTQATSPIRRYSDFFNQRLLRAYIEGSLLPYSSDEIDKIVANINEIYSRGK